MFKGIASTYSDYLSNMLQNRIEQPDQKKIKERRQRRSWLDDHGIRYESNDGKTVTQTHATTAWNVDTTRIKLNTKVHKKY
jgi:hypothetical protein